MSDLTTQDGEVTVRKGGESWYLRVLCERMEGGSVSKFILAWFDTFTGPWAQCERDQLYGELVKQLRVRMAEHGGTVGHLIVEIPDA